MATINNIGGTSLNVFSINGNVSFYQGITIPDNKMGKNGDYYFKTGEDGGFMYVKRNGVWLNLTTSSMPDARTIANKVIYSNGENYAPSGISYNADTKGTYMDGALVIGEHPAANNGNSKIVPTIGWINDPELSTNVVHRSGKESINGDKTFLQPIRINSNGLYTTVLALESSDIIKGGDIPEIEERTSQTRYWTVCAVDKTLYNHGNPITNEDTSDINYNKLGQFEVFYDIDKRVETKIEAFKPNADDERVRIAIGWNKNGKPYSYCSVLPDDKSNDNSIATTEWSNRNCVMLYGNQDVDGQKTFTDHITSKHKDGNHFGYRIQTNITGRGTAPKNTIDLQFVAQGNDGLDVNHRLGGMYVYYDKNGNIYSDLVAYKPEKYDKNNNPNNNAYIRIVYPLSGDPYTRAPHPVTDSDNNNIATTKWVNNAIKSKGSGKAIGEIIFSPIPLKESGLLLLNGQLVKRSTYTEFYDLIKGYLSDETYKRIVVKTSATTNTISNRPEANRGKFYINTSKNFLWLPDYRNLMTLNPSATKNNLGDYLKPGLPNITGTWAEDSFAGFDSGAISYGNILNGQSGSDRGTGKEVFFNASKSNSIYGASTTVQPESVKVFAYIVVSSSIKGDPATLNINKLTSEINDCKNTLINQADIISSLSNITTDIISTNAGKIRWWYDSKSKLLIQCGYIKSGIQNNSIVTFAKPYADTNYSVASSCGVKYYDAPWGTNTISIDNNGDWHREELQKSTTKFVCYQVHDITRWWIAIGKGA